MLFGMIWAKMLTGVFAQEGNPVPAIRAAIAAAPSDSVRVNGYMQLFGYYLTVATDWVRAKDALDTLHLLTDRSDNMVLRCRVIAAYGGYYSAMGESDRAIEAYFQGLKLYEKHTLPAGFRTGFLYNIAAEYEVQQDWAKAMRYYQICDSLELEMRKLRGLPLISVCALNMAKICLRQQQYPQAEQHFAHVAEQLRDSTRHDNPDWLEYLDAHARLKREVQQFAAAESLAAQLLATATRMQSPTYIARAHEQLSAIWRAQGKHAQAIAAASAAVATTDSLHSFQFSESAYQTLAESYHAAGKFAEAYAALQRSQVLHDSVLSESRQRNSLITEARFESFRKTQQIAALERDKQIRLAVIAALVAVLAAVLLVLNRHRLRVRLQRKELETQAATQALLTAQLQNAELRQAQAEAEARHSAEELQSFIARLSEKNAIIEQFRTEREQWLAADAITDTQPTTSPDKQMEWVTSLLDSTILTGADWEKFRQLFERVHPGFIARLEAAYPDLTATEVRTAAIARLGLPTKEIAAMLGVSPESVKKYRHRLSKKIALSDEADLDGFIASV